MVVRNAHPCDKHEDVIRTQRNGNALARVNVRKSALSIVVIWNGPTLCLEGIKEGQKG